MQLCIFGDWFLSARLSFGSSCTSAITMCEMRAAFARSAYASSSNFGSIKGIAKGAIRIKAQRDDVCGTNM